MVTNCLRRDESRLVGNFNTKPSWETEPRRVRKINGAGGDQPDLLQEQKFAQVDLDPFDDIGSFLDGAVVTVAWTFVLPAEIGQRLELLLQVVDPGIKLLNFRVGYFSNLIG